MGNDTFFKLLPEAAEIMLQSSLTFRARVLKEF